LDGLNQLKPLLGYLPPQALAQGDFGKALLSVGLWSVLLLVLSYRWFQQLAQPTVTPPTLATAGRNWTFPGPVGAIFSKQLRYLVRNSLSYVQLGAIAVVLGLWGKAVQPLWGTGGPWVAVLGVNLVLFLNSQRFNSIFAYDQQGFKTYLCAPVAGETVLWAYNLSHLLWVTGQILVGLCVIQGLWGQVDLQVLLAVLVTLGVLGVGYSAVGNSCSIYFPVSLTFGVGGRRGGSTVLLIALLANLGTSLLILPLLLFSFLTRYNGLWGNCGLLLCLGLAGLGYRALLPGQGRAMYQNREKLLTRLL
jgi:hypothetical protein